MEGIYPALQEAGPRARLASADRSFVSPADPAGRFSRLLSRFEPISLAEMAGVALQDRTDTKYVISSRQMGFALAFLAEDYRVLEIRGSRLQPYRTLYFDTEDFALYASQHAGKQNRYKVRSRKYVATNASVLEVKWNAKRGRTVKHRTQTTDLVTQLVPHASYLARASVLEASSLEPKLWNYFWRVTLVSKHYRERVTLDTGLQFAAHGQTITLPGVAVAEVKQDGLNRDSEFIQQMRAMQLHSSGFSKYCLGVATLYPEVKHNNFKPQMLLVRKLIGAPCDE